MVTVSIVGSNYVRFQYAITDNESGEIATLDYSVPLESTPCHFGGRRWWFICAGTGDGQPCGRRVGVLYLAGKYFSCRHCHRLVYDSSREHRSFSEPFMRRFRLIEKRDKILNSKGRKGLSRLKFSRLLKLLQKTATLPSLPEPVIVRKTVVIKQGKGKK